MKRTTKEIREVIKNCLKQEENCDEALLYVESFREQFQLQTAKEIAIHTKMTLEWVLGERDEMK